MIVGEKVEHDNINQDILESIYSIFDWGYAIIVIGGRIYVIEGDIQMADQFQSIDEHFIEVKDITKYVINNATHLISGQNKEVFISYLAEIKRRKVRYHKEEKYVRFSR